MSWTNCAQLDGDRTNIFGAPIDRPDGPFSPVLYRDRNAIERMFCRLKDYRWLCYRGWDWRGAGG